MKGDRILEIRHLSKTFGTNPVLKDIDFSVSSGDVTCIIGASGSGKSTLLRCLNLLETPTTGEIMYHGTNIADKKVNAPQYRSKVGMVFQSFNLFNNMTVLENCMIGQVKVLKKNKTDAHKNAMYYLEKVGMAPYINAKPRQLPADRNRGWPLPGHWPWSLRCCCSMSPHRHWTRRWWARCWRSCASWQERALP